MGSLSSTRARGPCFSSPLMMPTTKGKFVGQLKQRFSSQSARVRQRTDLLSTNYAVKFALLCPAGYPEGGLTHPPEVNPPALGPLDSRKGGCGGWQVDPTRRKAIVKG